MAMHSLPDDPCTSSPFWRDGWERAPEALPGRLAFQPPRQRVELDPRAARATWRSTGEDVLAPPTPRFRRRVVQRIPPGAAYDEERWAALMEEVA